MKDNKKQKESKKVFKKLIKDIKYALEHTSYGPHAKYVLKNQDQVDKTWDFQIAYGKMKDKHLQEFRRFLENTVKRGCRSLAKETDIDCTVYGLRTYYFESCNSTDYLIMHDPFFKENYKFIPCSIMITHSYTILFPYATRVSILIDHNVFKLRLYY